MYTLLAVLLPLVIFACEYDGREQGLTTWPTDIPTDVENIRLDRNDLTTIPVGALDGFTSLQNFQAKRNDIFQSDVEDALTIPRTLQTLDLENNKLVGLRLELSPSAKSVSSLEELVLAYNILNTFPDISHHIANTLKDMDLQGNQLAVIDSESLPTFTSLENLNLQDNQITTIQAFDLDALHPSFQLDISNNPLHCDGDLIWMKMIVPPRTLTIDSQPCTSPSKYVGQYWTDLTGNEGKIIFIAK